MGPIVCLSTVKLLTVSVSVGRRYHQSTFHGRRVEFISDDLSDLVSGDSVTGLFVNGGAITPLATGVYGFVRSRSGTEGPAQFSEPCNLSS